MFRKVLYEAAKETLVEYLNKTSLNGCRLLYVIRKRKYERLVWFIFIVATIAFACYVCTTFLTSFLGQPTVATLDPQAYTIYEAPFPAVGVCSHNKFSRQAIWNYASNIAARSETNQTLTYWVKRLEMLSGLYNYDSIDPENAEELHGELENILGEKFVTSKILKMLAPLCEDLLVACFWAGRSIDCKNQFGLKMFMDGPCCVFNYQYKNDLDSLYYPIDVGPENGLAFIVNSSTNDYFYAENSAIGFYIKLFSTEFIPDSRLGNAEFHVGVAEDVHVALDLFSQVTSEDARFYSVDKRHCYFPYEQGQATLNEPECILKCQVAKTGWECECNPFYAVNTDIEYKGKEEISNECSLLNIGCLKSIEYEFLDPTGCVNCYIRCSFNRYWFQKAVNPLSSTLLTHNNLNYLQSIVNITRDMSLVKIFYPSEAATKFKSNVIYGWHHILSQIGGVLGICMGCSIINCIEMIYFACYRLMEKFSNLRRTQFQIHTN